MRVSRAIRAGAWALVAAGVAAPLLRRRVRLPPAGVLLISALAAPALAVAAPPGRRRDVGVCLLNGWAYLAAYELPHDDPEHQASRVRVDYPLAADKLLGLGVPLTVRLQHGLSTPGRIRPFERVLVVCHWLWFAVPHATVAYVWWRRPSLFTRAAALMYGTFDTGAVFYWLIPTAPPWWAAREGRLEIGGPPAVRRMMIEYGEEFWGRRWPALYDSLGGNPLAAMPSLHFATSLMAAHLLSEVGPLSGSVGWLYTGLLGLALVYLGEHYVIDLVAGAAMAEGIRAGAPAATPLVRRALGGLERLNRLAAAT